MKQKPDELEEVARQCRVEAHLLATTHGRKEMALWEKVAADAWADLGASPPIDSAVKGGKSEP
jgi:hypothetical protein